MNSMMQDQAEVTLRPWAEGDFWLVERTMGDPAMTEHLGGPESPEKLRSRHERYCRVAETGIGQMFVILVGDEHRAAGSIGYWEHEWQGQPSWETGWSVLPEFQGQGIATQAIHAVVTHARATAKHPFMHAFPSIANGPSNAICRKAGFTLQGKADFEYPPGHWMECNDWRLEL
jgi:RimJ/RimL family protein N-acetyltransferase